MSRYLDGKGWFKFLLHINKQTEVCAKLTGFNDINNLEPMLSSLWLLEPYKKEYRGLLKRIILYVNKGLPDRSFKVLHLILLFISKCSYLKLNNMKIMEEHCIIFKSNF